MTAISYQLYSSRFSSIEDSLPMLAETGYREVEGYGALLTEADRLAEGLAASGLRMTTAHIPFEMIAEDPEGVLALADRFGLEAVFVPIVSSDDRPADAAGWEALADRLFAAGAPLRAAGLRFGWHNHDFELDDLGGGATALDILAGAGLDLELDIGWIARARVDPVATIARFRGRIAAAHIKDLAPEGGNADEDGWADVGHGTLDWPAIHTALQAAGVGRYVVEHDNPSDHRRFARRSLAYLSALGATA